MKHPFLLVAFSVLSLVTANAQNVGIGTTTPTYPLTVIASTNKGIVQKDGAVEVGFFTNASSAYLQTWTNHPLRFAANNGTAALSILPNKYVGIGTTAPLTPFQVEVTSSFSGPVGIGTTTPATTLHVIGTASVMSNIGIGTTLPTTNLDINGNMRLRGGSPAAGAILTSTDANGNVEWGRTVAFRAPGGVGGANIDIPNSAWTKIAFNTTPSYNLSLAYQPIAAQFVAPETAIYHFDAHLQWLGFDYEVAVRARVNHNGGISTVASSTNDYGQDIIDGHTVIANLATGVSFDIRLDQGDIIWIEGYRHAASGATGNISGFAGDTWFTGHLEARF